MVDAFTGREFESRQLHREYEAHSTTVLWAFLLSTPSESLLSASVVKEKHGTQAIECLRLKYFDLRCACEKAAGNLAQLFFEQVFYKEKHGTRASRCYSFLRKRFLSAAEGWSACEKAVGNPINIILKGVKR